MKNIIGWLGALLFLFAYSLIAFNLINSSGYLYNTMQLIGACCLGWRVYLDKNYSNLTLEAVMIIVAIYKIGEIFYGKI